MIRAATPADLPALRALQSLLPETAPELLLASIDGPGIVLVSVGDESVGPLDDAHGLPVGYVLATVGPETAHIAELVVAPARRREGRGRRLLAAALARLRATDATRVELAVNPDNDTARRLYESFGFEEMRREAEYYESGPAVLLSRPL
ncbi:GNAT family N-acetyltransferase [Halostella sp. JP-L12]|uniref:GNAT family N-acetyltransferase n=1 Tax=Halostella TaxID=1843185 RepID=UPI000EF7EA70|nr:MULTISPECIES: GNAT family N-acetyltransferase [Halostella]NHN47100.1 GNAT family N-acetyltransferase [Halostella sp. JP-L12]